jgi:hypothetical protein
MTSGVAEAGEVIEHASTAVAPGIWLEIARNQEEAEEDSIMAVEFRQVEEEIGIEEEEVVLKMVVVVEVEILVAALEEVDAGEVMEEGDINYNYAS